MAMLKDESQILKSVMIKVNDSTVLLVTEQYHTERADSGKVDRSKSKYRWLARVFNLDDLKKYIFDLYDDTNRLIRYKWPNDPDPWYICNDNDSTNGTIGNWLSIKLKKMMTWEDGMKKLDGWETKTAKREAGYNISAAYDTEDYVDENGQLLSLKDKDELLKRVNQTLYKARIMKSKQTPIKSN